jgi:flavin reductase (DIM6/NTAB) family NADH-FMN oxidoreductase RutF
MATPTPLTTLPEIQQHFAHSIGLITSGGGDQPPNIMACEWTTVVCWDPIMIMVVIGNDDLTSERIRASQEFGVSIAAESQSALASCAGNASGREYQKLDAPEFEGLVYSGRHIQAPLIRGAALNAECRVEQMVNINDEYTGFIGRVVAAEIDETVRPLVYHKGKFFSLGRQIIRRRAA